MSEGRNGDGPANGKGSVRRARERAENGLPFNGPPPPRQPPPVPAIFKSGDQGPKGPMISKPTLVPQWPLRDNDASREKSSSPENSSPPRGPQPQRPPRPSNVPSLLDSSKVQEYAPSMPARKPPQAPLPGPPANQASSTPSPEEKRLLSPYSTQESTTSGTSERPSTDSSVGTIPDFPLPAAQVPQPPPPPAAPPSSTSGRKSANLGPPPTSRRGASSFYSSNSYVSPIREESPENPRRGDRSLASSKVMPSSWGSGPADSEILGAYEYSRHSEDDSDSAPSIHGEDDGEVTLVRQASLGKRGKPALRTINKSGDSTSADDANSRPKTPDTKENPLPNSNGPPVPAPVGANPALAKEAGLAPPMGDHPMNRGHSGSTSSDESSNYDLEKFPIALKLEPSMKEVEDGAFKEGVSGRRGRKLETKRPPRLDMDAVRDAEARGSMTSLPDLIRRATRLASNLDRGKTASRFGIMDMLGQNGDQKKSGQRQSGSISDILASFPPPGAAGAQGGNRRGGPDQYQDDRNGNPNPEDLKQGKPGSRCCGIPRWAFVMILIVLVLIVAAAIIIPIVLVVLPRQAENDRPPFSEVTPMPDTCAEIQPCQNGGVSVGTPDSCGCVCVGGFSGSACSVAADNSCTTLDINDGSMDLANATMGNALPRLFEAAESNFSIPLNASEILMLFNTEDMSCTSANAIVTFNGSSRKRELPISADAEDTAGIDPDSPAKRLLRLSTPNRPHKHRNRQVEPPLSRDRPLQKVNNPGPTRTSAAPSKTPPPTSSATPSTTPSPLSSRVIDFGRVAVLFILERTGDLEDATAAQDSIQRLFRRAMGGGGSTSDESEDDGDKGGTLGDPMDVECESQQFSLDFAKFTITIGDGTVVGGGAGGR